MARSSLYPVPLLVATILAAHGLRKGSLSFSGAVAALLVGYFHLACPLKYFGVSLIAFYLIGSRVTKVKVAEKAKWEDGPDLAKAQGNRDAIQVLSNSLPTLISSLSYRFRYSALVDPTTSCVTASVARPLIFLSLAHFSTSLADTLASELGILSSARPYHIITFDRVPKGTNGGVSPLGLTVSLVGGLVMGIVAVVDLLIEFPGCRTADSGWTWTWAVEILLFSSAAGLAGSLLDSLLGATMQQTLYSPTTGRILTDRSKSSPKDKHLVPIGFGQDVLSNSGVNFVSTGMMAGVGYYYGGGRFGVLGF